MIQGITTPNDHITALETVIEKIAAPEGVNDQVFKEVTGYDRKDVRAAVSTLRDLYQQYIGVLALAAGMAVELREGCNDSRDSIENALVDAVALGAPITYKRIFDRFDIGIGVQVEDDELDEDQEG